MRLIKNHVYKSSDPHEFYVIRDITKTHVKYHKARLVYDAGANTVHYRFFGTLGSVTRSEFTTAVTEMQPNNICYCCPHCNMAMPKDSGHNISNTTRAVRVCSSCAAQYVRCIGCGQIHNKTEMHRMLTPDGALFGYLCVDNNGNGEVKVPCLIKAQPALGGRTRRICRESNHGIDAGPQWTSFVLDFAELAVWDNQHSGMCPLCVGNMQVCSHCGSATRQSRGAKELTLRGKRLLVCPSCFTQHYDVSRFIGTYNSTPPDGWQIVDVKTVGKIGNRGSFIAFDKKLPEPVVYVTHPSGKRIRCTSSSFYDVMRAMKRADLIDRFIKQKFFNQD